MKEHGGFVLRRDGQLILITLEGAWNVPTFDRYEEELTQLIRAVAADGPWAIVMDARRWELSTPEVLPRVRRLSGWADEQKVKGTAIITGGSPLKESVARDTIYGKGRQAAVAMFHMPDEALEWIRALGFEAGPSLRAALNHRLGTDSRDA